MISKEGFKPSIYFEYDVLKYYFKD
jgi:hypothetical protein